MSTTAAGISAWARRRRHLWALLVIGAGVSMPAVPAGATGRGTWSGAGQLSVRRVSDHTATLLRDGDVLVVGGYVAYRPTGGDEVTAAADLFDTRSARWTLAPMMHQSRAQHTSTLLADGRVLVAGGIGQEENLLSSAEIYDPSTRTWTPSGAMHDARMGHTATLLPDGKVLVAGGLGNGTSSPIAFLDRVEIYDPVTGTWSQTQPMGSPRVEHSATLLADGSVLVVGGDIEPRSPALRSAEVYQPSAGSWKTVSHLANTERAAHTAATLPDGKVLLVGGSTRLGHGGGGIPTPFSELYDPATQTFTRSTTLVHPRIAEAAAVLPGGRVLVVGGFDRIPENLRSPAVVGSAELYDPTTRKWALTGPLVASPTAAGFRAMMGFVQGGNASATLLAGRRCAGNCGKVLVVGGDDAKVGAQLYTPLGLEGAGPHSSGLPSGLLVALGSALVVTALMVTAAVVTRRRRGMKQ